MKALLLALAALLGCSLAQTPRDGGQGEVRLDEGAPGKRILVEVWLEPERTGNSELMVFARPRERGVEGTLLRELVPPESPGRYRLELTLPEAGDWGLTFRYGVGLDLYYASVSERLEPEGVRTLRRELAFRGDLADGAPPYIQPLGFLVFGLVLAGALFLIIKILRWIAQQRRTGEKVEITEGRTAR